jgi:zinc/manganese transport system ATP-binding protein
MVAPSLDNTLIKAQNLTAKYGQKTIWKDADFTIKRGEFVALLGPNGAGKTTLFRLLLGLDQPASGTLQLFGQEPRRGNARIGYIPQRRPIDTDMRVEALELVNLGLSGLRWGVGSPAKTRDEQAQALTALAQVDAANLAHRSLGELSGGELQRVFLAQALVSKPDLLLLDEPLANLDIRREAELVQLVRDVTQTEHVAVLLIAHNINPLLPVVDRIIYIVNGHVATGKPHDIITTESLSRLYDAPIEVLHDSHGRIAVLGSEEAVHHD